MTEPLPGRGPRLGRIESYRDEPGITTLLARAQWPGVSQDVVLRGVRLLGEQVIPAFRRSR